MNVATFLSYFRASRSLSEAVKRIIADFPSYREVSIYARARRLKCRFDVKGRFFQSNGQNNDESEVDEPHDARRSSARQNRVALSNNPPLSEDVTSGSEMEHAYSDADQEQHHEQPSKPAIKQPKIEDSSESEYESESDTESDSVLESPVSVVPSRMNGSVDTQYLDILAQATRLSAFIPLQPHFSSVQFKHEGQIAGSQHVHHEPIKPEPVAFSPEEQEQRSITEATEQVASRVLGAKHQRINSRALDVADVNSLAQLSSANADVLRTTIPDLSTPEQPIQQEQPHPTVQQEKFPIITLSTLAPPPGIAAQTWESRPMHAFFN